MPLSRHHWSPANRLPFVAVAGWILATVGQIFGHEFDASPSREMPGLFAADEALLILDDGPPSFADVDTSRESSTVSDPPISYGGPAPATVEDIEARDGPRIPEPLVFDLVRGLGARKGEFEINVLNIVPFKSGKPTYEWAPEVEWAVADGFAIEYELPVFETQIVAHKFALQYTFGTALDDAFIHGVQSIGYYDTGDGEFIPTLLYLAGLRFDKMWSVFGMFGFSVGPQIFPFVDGPSNRRGTDLIYNVSIFADLSDRLVAGIETNLSRQISGPSEFLFMPQVHYGVADHVKAQFGFGYRDDAEKRFGELAFRVIFER